MMYVSGVPEAEDLSGYTLLLQFETLALAEFLVTDVANVILWDDEVQLLKGNITIITQDLNQRTCLGVWRRRDNSDILAFSPKGN